MANFIAPFSGTTTHKSINPSKLTLNTSSGDIEYDGSEAISVDLTDYMTKMYIAEYGSSTFADVLAAYRAQKIVYCRVDKRMAFLAYVSNKTNPTSFEFQYYRSIQTHADNQQGDQVFVYTLTNASGGTWTTVTREAYTKVDAGTNMSKNYSNGTLTLSAADPTVKLTEKTAHGQYKLLISSKSSVTSGSVYEAGYDSSITVEPSTHTITAANFAGNATTATTAGNVTGIVAIANGGTGATSAADARTNLGLGTIATASSSDYVLKAGDTMTGTLSRYYASASTDPMLRSVSNNQDSILFITGNGAEASAVASNYYKLLYKGTGSSPSNYLQLISAVDSSNEKIAVQWDENGNATYNGEAHFNLGTANTTTADRKFTIQGASSNKLSLGSTGIQAYNSSNTASTLSLQYYGGSLNIGSSSTSSATREFYGQFDFKSTTGFTYSGMGAASDDAARNIWFSYNGVVGRPVYDNDFKYNPSTNIMTIGTGTLSATQYSGNSATSTKSGVSTIWLYPENNNEINFGGTHTGTIIYFGYRAKDSRAIPTKFVFGSSTGTADLQVKTVYLGSGTSSYVSSTQYTGNAASATKVAAKLATTTKSYLLGTSTTITATAANVDLLGDTGVYLTTTAGELSVLRYSWHDSSSNEKAYTVWNSDDQSIDFVFA